MATGDLLMSTARSLRHAYVEALRAWEITPAQARALRVIESLGTVALSVVAERLRIAPRSATEVVDALEVRGLVARGSDPSDRRVTTVSTTDAGRELLVASEATRQAAAEDLLAVLSPADRGELDRILGLLVER